MSENFFLKIRHFEKFSFQDLTCCIFFQSKVWRVWKLSNQIWRLLFFFKSDTLYFFWFKFCFSNHPFRFSLIYYQSANNIKGQPNDNGWGQNDFVLACGLCLSHFWYYLFNYCVHYGTWFLDGFDDYFIRTTNWFIRVSWEFGKRLVYKDFILRETKLLVQLPRLSRKQSTIFISSFSNLVFLTRSTLSANTYPLVCVDLVFWKELNKCFLYFLLKSLFSAMLGILSTPLFWWLKWTANYQRVVHSWHQFCQWSGTWKVYTDSPRVGSWNRMHPISVTPF